MNRVYGFLMVIYRFDFTPCVLKSLDISQKIPIARISNIMYICVYLKFEI